MAGNGWLVLLVGRMDGVPEDVQLEVIWLVLLKRLVGWSAALKGKCSNENLVGRQFGFNSLLVFPFALLVDYLALIVGRFSSVVGPCFTSGWRNGYFNPLGLH